MTRASRLPYSFAIIVIATATIASAQTASNAKNADGKAVARLQSENEELRRRIRELEAQLASVRGQSPDNSVQPSQAGGQFYAKGQRPIKFSRISFVEKPPELTLYNPDDLLKSVDFLVLRMAGNAKMDLKFKDIKAIACGPCPPNVFGSGYGNVTMHDGRKFEGAFSGKAGSNVDFVLLVNNTPVTVDLAYGMQESRIEFDTPK